MTFEQRLHAMIAAPAPTTQNRPEYSRDPPGALVAVHAPQLLKRLAVLAGALQRLPPRGGQGVILACRNGPLGYRSVEYSSHDLHIVLDATEHEAYLRWDASGESGTYVLTPETTAPDLDRAVLQAVAAFVPAHTPVKATWYYQP